MDYVSDVAVERTLRHAAVLSVFPTNTKKMGDCVGRLYDFFINFLANPTEHSGHRTVNLLACAMLSGLTLSDAGFHPMAKMVLVVDDNAVIRQALCRLFTSEAGFEVCGEAENGRDAIEKAQALHPDLIVMDLSMPVMNGIYAARALKTLMPTVPIIIFSEYSNVFSDKEARSAGISALVLKSEHVSVLIGKARALLEPTAA